MKCSSVHSRKAAVAQACVLAGGVCGITVGDNKHSAVRGEEEIERQRQEQPCLIKTFCLMLPDPAFILSHSCMEMYSPCSI